MKWGEMIGIWEDGNITRHELGIILVCYFKDASNIRDFVINASIEWKEFVDSLVLKAPNNEDDWGRMRIFGANMSKEEGENILRDYRRGVENYRKFSEEGVKNEVIFL